MPCPSLLPPSASPSWTSPASTARSATSYSKPWPTCSTTVPSSSAHPVRQFEERSADLCGSRFAVAVGSGTDRAFAGLAALKIGPGDEVITTPSSFVATAAAIALTGARPVFVDVGDDYNIDPELIEEAITPRTKAVLPVHLTGRPADMKTIDAIAARHGLLVVEDAAEPCWRSTTVGAVGSIGMLGCFSLHPLKTLNACGDGGIITTDDPDLSDRLHVLRNLGLRTRATTAKCGAAIRRLDTLQARCCSSSCGTCPSGRRHGGLTRPSIARPWRGPRPHAAAAGRGT